MSTWVGVNNWIIVDVSIAVPCLNTLACGDNAIRLGEASEGGVVSPALRYGDATQPPCIIEHEAEASAAQVRGFVVDVRVLSRTGVARWEGGIAYPFGHPLTYDS